MADRMLVTTAPFLDGCRAVRTLGVVRGIVVRSPGIRRSFVAGNVREYEEVCEQARAHAHERTVEHATELGVNAILGMRYDATEFMQGVAELLCYGTAVVVAGE